MELFLVLLLKPGEHLCIIHTLGLVVQHQYPTAGGILRIEVELSALHGGLDVAGAAAHALSDLHVIAGLLNEKAQHLSQDVLFRHGLGGDPDRVARAGLPSGGGASAAAGQGAQHQDG